jgi:hypothetical protein
MPVVTDCSDGYVPPPQTGPNLFRVADPRVISSEVESIASGILPTRQSRVADLRILELPNGSKVVAITPMAQVFGLRPLILKQY